MQIAVATGRRRGGFVALRGKDVDLERGQIHVRHREDFRTKFEAERVMSAVKPDRLTKRFEDMAENAEPGERIHFHSLRHTAGWWLAMRGVPV